MTSVQGRHNKRVTASIPLPGLARCSGPPSLTPVSLTHHKTVLNRSFAQYLIEEEEERRERREYLKESKIGSLPCHLL